MIERRRERERGEGVLFFLLFKPNAPFQEINHRTFTHRTSDHHARVINTEMVISKFKHRGFVIRKYCNCPNGIHVIRVKDENKEDIMINNNGFPRLKKEY